MTQGRTWNCYLISAIHCLMLSWKWKEIVKQSVTTNDKWDYMFKFPLWEPWAKPILVTLDDMFASSKNINNRSTFEWPLWIQWLIVAFTRHLTNNPYADIWSSTWWHNTLVFSDLLWYENIDMIKNIDLWDKFLEQLTTLKSELQKSWDDVNWLLTVYQNTDWTLRSFECWEKMEVNHSVSITAYNSDTWIATIKNPNHSNTEDIHIDILNNITVEYIPLQFTENSFDGSTRAYNTNKWTDHTIEHTTLTANVMQYIIDRTDKFETWLSQSTLKDRWKVVISNYNQWVEWGHMTSFGKTTAINGNEGWMRVFSWNKTTHITTNPNFDFGSYQKFQIMDICNMIQYYKSIEWKWKNTTLAQENWFLSLKSTDWQICKQLLPWGYIENSFFNCTMEAGSTLIESLNTLE
jgi:hypothetical protein